MKHRGLLTGMILGLVVAAGMAQAQDVSVFEREQSQLDRHYGIEIIGDQSSYAMDDVNNFRASEYHTGNTANASSGTAWGLAFLYRTNKHLRWTVGYTSLGQDKSEGSWVDPTNNTVGLNEQTVSGNEYYLVPSFTFEVIKLVSVNFGAGPAIYSGKLDRRSTSAQSVYNAHGRTMGFRASGGVEVFLGKGLSLHVLAGYRAAKIGTLVYKDRDETQQTLYWGTSNRTMSLDFSGMFFEGGLRIYFQPATGWFTM